MVEEDVIIQLVGSMQKNTVVSGNWKEQEHLTVVQY